VRTYNFPDIPVAAGILKMTIMTDAPGGSSGVNASMSFLFGTPAEFDNITIGIPGVGDFYFEFHETLIESYYFNSDITLAALVSAVDGVDAEAVDGVITITAEEPGAAGNNITVTGVWNTSLYPGHLFGGADPTPEVQDMEGDWVLSVGRRDEAIEEQTLGGFMQLQDVTVEVVDNNHLFRDEIFNRDLVTAAQAKLIIEQNGIDHEFLYGDIDLGSVHYRLYHAEDAVDAEGDETSCSFTVYSFLKRLERLLPSDLKPYLETKKVFGKYIYSNAGVTFYQGNFVKLTDVFDAFVSLLGLPFDPVEFTCVQRFQNRTGSDIGLGPAFPTAAWHTFDKLWILFDLTGAEDETISADWFKENPASGLGLMALRDCKAVIEQLAALFLMYPLLTYDPATDKLKLKLIQRTQGGAATPGPTQEQVQEEFRGYDAIRVQVTPNGTGSVNRYRDIYPGHLSDAHFDLVEQRFDMFCQLRLAGTDGVQTWGTWNNVVVRSTVSGYTYVVSPIQAVKDEDGTIYTGRYTNFLLKKFIEFWGKPRRLFRRRVIGTDFTNLRLAKLVKVGQDWYTATKLVRDIVADLAEVELLQYPLPGFVPEFPPGGDASPDTLVPLVNYDGVQLQNARGELLYAG
jgi:hypothetical protein